jgi:hypothetical protein
MGASVYPGLQQYVLSILSGDPSKASGYASSMRAPIESATQRTIEGIISRTPRSGYQQELIEKARMAGGLKFAETEQDYIRQALAMAASLFGYRPSPMGQTMTTSGGPKAGINLGPLSFTI